MANFFLFLDSAPELSITLLRCNFFISSDARGTLKKIARIVHVKGSIVRIHIQTFFLPKQRFIFFRITSLFRQVVGSNFDFKAKEGKINCYV